MAFQAGTAFVPIMPSFRGFQARISEETGAGGRRAGERFSRSFQESGERGARGLGEKLKGALGKLDGVMEKVGLAGGAALGAGLAKAVSVQDAQGKLQAQLGLTAKESERFGKIAGTLYSQAYGESIEDVNDAIAAVVSSIDGMRGASNEAVQSMTAKALSLAKAFDIEVSRAVQVVGQLVKSGLVKDAEQGMDLLTASLQKVPAAVREDVIDALDEYGPFMQQIGLKGQQAFELLVQGAEKGMYGIDKTGDALKEFTIRATDMSAATQEAYKTLGLDTEKVTNDLLAGGQRGSKAFQLIITKLRGIKDPAEQSQAALALFGTPLEDLGTKDIPKFLGSLDTTQRTLGNTSGAADRMGNALQNTAGQKLTAFKRSVETNIVNTLSESVLPKLEELREAGQKFGLDSGDLVKAALALTALAGAIKLATFATTAWSIAQAILNAVLWANPFGLIALAVIGLGAALVLAYKKSETFRNIVTTVWNGVLVAVQYVWNLLKPIFNLYKWYLVNVIGTALKWYWAYVKFVFTTVWTVIKWAWGLIKPVFNGIASVIRAVVGRAFTYLMNIVKIAWIAIQIAIKVAWAFIRPIWNSIKFALSKTLGPAFNGFKKLAGDAWKNLKSVISSVWNGGIKPAFDKLKSALKDVQHGFSVAVSAIKKIWGGLKAAAKTPVNFVIGIYNKGIVGLVNKLADFAGVKTRLNEIPKLARGGTLDNPLPAQPMITNGALAIVGEGRQQYPEFVIPTDPRYRRRAQALWAMAGRKVMGEKPANKWLRGPHALSGEGIGFARGGSLQALAFGGIIGKFVDGVKNFTVGNISKGAETLLNKVLGGALPGAGTFRDVVAGIPGWIKKSVLEWVKKKVATFGGGPAMERALKWARTQDGKPYQWGGNGNPSWDCSGFMSAIESVIRGEKPHRRWATASFRGGTPPGWHRNAKSGFMIGVLDNGNAHASHTAGTLLGHRVESSGSGGVQVDGGARGFNDSMFPWKYGLKFDSGGLLPQGATLALHNARRPDRVLTDAQWSAIYGAARGGDGPSTSYTINARKADFTVRDLEVLQRKQDAAARLRRPR